MLYHGSRKITAYSDAFPAGFQTRSSIPCTGNKVYERFEGGHGPERGWKIISVICPSFCALKGMIYPERHDIP